MSYSPVSWEREYPRVSHSTGSYPPQYPPGPELAIISPAETWSPSVCLTSAMCSQPCNPSKSAAVQRIILNTYIYRGVTRDELQRDPVFDIWWTKYIFDIRSSGDPVNNNANRETMEPVFVCSGQMGPAPGAHNPTVTSITWHDAWHTTHDSDQLSRGRCHYDGCNVRCLLKWYKFFFSFNNNLSFWERFVRYNNPLCQDQYLC